MTQYFLRYQFILKEPVIITDGSQIGNILQTRDHIPGSTILGACAGLYLNMEGKAATEKEGVYSQEFRDLFLSEKTIFSPAYPLGPGGEKTFPMPLSVFGCKYYGTNAPGKKEKHHGFSDYLYKEIPDDGKCPKCPSPLEHKRGYAYLHKKIGYCNADVTKEIISHNKVSDEPDEKRLFSFEAIAEGQGFYGEITFSHEDHRELFRGLLAKDTIAHIGKARNRGYGRVRFLSPQRKKVPFRTDLGSLETKDGMFSIYLFSDAILTDRLLNYSSVLNEDQLAFWMGLDPNDLVVYHKPGDEYKSFWKNDLTLGFNQHRGMPLPAEQTIARGSVFTVLYGGDEDIVPKLEQLQNHGLGLRRNEGFGQVVINHRIHSAI